MIEFIYKTDKTKVNAIMKQSKDFSEFIEKNKFLNDEKDKKVDVKSPPKHMTTFSFLPEEYKG